MLSFIDISVKILFGFMENFVIMYEKGEESMRRISRHFIKRSLFILFVFWGVAFWGIQSEAATVLRTGTVRMYSEDIYKHIAFNMPKTGIVRIGITIKRTDNKPFKTKEKWNIVLAERNPADSIIDHYDWSDDLRDIEKDRISLQSGSSQWTNDYYYTKALSSGKYCYRIENISGYSGPYTISYRIFWHPCLSNSYKTTKTSMQLTVGKNGQFSVKGIPSGSYPIINEIYSTNDSVAEVEWIENDNYEFNYKVIAKKAGTCKIVIKGNKGIKYVTVKVINPKVKLKYTSLYFSRGESAKNELMYTNAQVKWSSSNNSVATVSSTGKITAKNIGTCKITARANGKNYVCKVIVQYLNPNFGAVLDSYYSRGKQFTVKFKNNGAKDITILSSGASALHCDYTSLDRKLRVSKAIIRPGQTKYIKFTAYQQPFYIWYDYTINYYFTYDGKTYNGRVWDSDSTCKYSNGKWYTTYWTTFTDWYDYWKL